MFRNFDFVKSLDTVIAKDLNSADEILYCLHDPQGCILKVGATMEYLIYRVIALMENITLLRGYGLGGYISNLARQDILDEQTEDAFRYIVRNRNKANHDGLKNEHNAQVCLKKAHIITSYFVKQYNIGSPTEYKTSTFGSRLSDSLISA